MFGIRKHISSGPPHPEAFGVELCSHLAVVRNHLNIALRALDELAADEQIDPRERGLAWGHSHWVESLVVRVSYEIGRCEAGRPLMVSFERGKRPGGDRYAVISTALRAAADHFGQMAENERLTAGERTQSEARAAELDEALRWLIGARSAMRAKSAS